MCVEFRSVEQRRGGWLASDGIVVGVVSVLVVVVSQASIARAVDQGEEQVGVGVGGGG